MLQSYSSNTDTEKKEMSGEKKKKIIILRYGVGNKRRGKLPG